MRKDLVGHMLSAKWQFFVNQPSGGLANAVSGEVNSASYSIMEGCRSLAMVTQVISYALMVALFSWEALLFAGLVGCLVVGLQSFVVKFSSRVGKKEATTTQAFVVFLLGIIQNMKPIRAMGREGLFKNKLDSQVGVIERAMTRRLSAQQFSAALHEPILGLAMGVGFLFIYNVVELDFAFLMVIGALFWRLSVNVNRTLLHFQAAAARQHFYWSVMDLIEKAKESNEVQKDTQNAPKEYDSITFDDVHFAYEESQPIFDGLSLTIPTNKMTILVGQSGVGKSTLLNMLLGFEQPTRGAVEVGGVSLSMLQKTAWRNEIGFVPQEMILMHCSILENITFGDREIPEEAVIDALKTAEIWDFVSSLTDGIHTVVGEQGGRLSGGQRQRISLARALVSSPSLLILDEVTTSLDPETERAVVETLSKLKERLTIVAVTHQKALAESADRVFRLDGSGKAILESS
jgi:ATP-binding cassette subfamily C protein